MQYIFRATNFTSPWQASYVLCQFWKSPGNITTTHTNAQEPDNVTNLIKQSFSTRISAKSSVFLSDLGRFYFYKIIIVSLPFFWFTYYLLSEFAVAVAVTHIVLGVLNGNEKIYPTEKYTKYKITKEIIVFS